MDWTLTDEEVAYYKSLNQDQKANGEYYKTMLPILLELVNHECDQNFKPDALPGNVKLFLAKAALFYSMGTGVKSRKMGSVSYSYELSELPVSITTLLNRYRKAKYHVFRPI